LNIGPCLERELVNPLVTLKVSPKYKCELIARFIWVLFVAHSN